MQRSLLSWVFVLLVFSCTPQEKTNFTLTGKIDGIEDSVKIFMSIGKGYERYFDSAYVVGGTFRFERDLAEPAKARLLINHRKGTTSQDVSRGADLVDFYIEPGNINLTSPDSLTNATITGSPSTDEMYRWNEMAMETYNLLRTWRRKLYAAAGSDGILPPGFMDEYNEAITGPQEELNAKMKQYIAENPSSYFSLDEFFRHLLGDGESAEDYQRVFDLYSPQLQNTELGQQYALVIKRLRGLEVGVTAPDFTQDDPDGRPVSLSDFRGTYVLLDFWASWCGPCRKENPYVVAAYEKYRDRNFTVLGISLDTKRERWLQAIAEDGLAWTNVSDLGGLDNPVARLYTINGIPDNFLLDPEGKVLARGLRGEALEDKLAEILD